MDALTELRLAAALQPKQVQPNNDPNDTKKRIKRPSGNLKKMIKKSKQRGKK